MCRKPFGHNRPDDEEAEAWPEPALGRAIKMTRSQKAHDQEQMLKLAQEIYDSLQSYRNRLRFV